MNEEALEALRFLAFFSILTVIYCAFRYCLAYCENDDDHPTHPGLSLHGIKAAGINPSVLQSISIVPFNSRDFKDNVECVVCLSELVDGDKTRVLPSCNHCFHADCIDTWLQSDSTCPICRKRVEEIQNNELPLRTNADSGEAYEDMTAVVIDMSAEPDIRVSGLIKASVLNDL